MRKSSSIITIILCFVFSLSFVAAFEFDNVGQFSKNQTQAYGEVIIKNGYGLIPFFDYTISKHELKRNTDFCRVECRAYLHTERYVEGSLYTDLSFKNSEGATVNIKNATVYLVKYVQKTREEIKRKAIYDSDGNLKGLKEISRENITYLEENLIPYHGEVLPVGSYDWVIIGMKETWESVDWHIWIDGVNLGQWWAWWQGYQPIMYFKFNENGNGNALDSSGNNRTALSVISGNSGYVTGKLGNALNITTSGDYLYNKTAPLLGLQSFTIAFWLKMNTIVVGTYVFTYADGGGGGTDGSLGVSLATSQNGNVSINMKDAGADYWIGDNQTQKDLIWHRYVVTRDNSTGTNSCKFYRDNMLISQIDCPTNLNLDNSNGGAANNLVIGGNGGGGQNIQEVTLDDLQIYNIKWSAADVTNDWNGGVGKEGDDIPAIPDISINLTRPSNNTVFTTNVIGFNTTITPLNGANLTNATVQIYSGGSIVATNTTNLAFTNVTTAVALNISGLADGIYFWNVLGGFSNSTGANQSYATAPQNLSFTKDSTFPIVNILYPINGTEITTFTSMVNVTFNTSTIDNLALSDCFVYNETANISVACGANTTIQVGEGYHTFIRYANDTANNLAQNATTFFVNYVRYNVSAPNVVEGENNSIYLNVTATSITSLNGNITHNYTFYQMNTTNNGTLGRLGINLTAPYVEQDTYINFSINFSVNGLNLNTGNYSQLVYNIPNLTINTTCNTTALQFNLLDEENLTSLVGTFEYNFLYGLSNNTLVRTFGQISNVSSFSVCTNTTISQNFTLGQGEIFYHSNGYADRRYYLFSGLTLTNTTNNISLHSLLNSLQTSFQLEVEDTALNPYKNKYTTLVRWYPNLNQYRVVDMGQTDEKGTTVIHVRTEDVDYRIGVYEQNGTQIKLANAIRMVCLTSPCTYTLKISPTDDDFTSFLNVQYTLVFNETTGIWSYTYSDSTQRTNTMNLTIYRDTGIESYAICSSTTTGYIGAISCNTSAYLSGTQRAVVIRTASPPVVIATQTYQILSSAFKNTYGLFFSFILALAIIFVLAMMSPIAALIGGVVALIPALYFGSINIAIIGGIAVLSAIVAHFIKRVG